ncbi:MAG TPA: RNA 2',3'-cyclic phosphodiesterase [Acidimicrobiia bacterium]|nr:RNA 2',3'-cyclic phosphodiesterase [Acidimicrobiia bacterium]
MTRLARAFVAVVPPGDVLDALAARIARLTPDAQPLRWLPRAQWHITLTFLGRVDDADALRDTLTTTARRGAPFALQLAAGGAFPTPRRAAVLWVGVADPPALVRLADAVRASGAPLGDHADDRPYHPHLTVARAPRPRNLTGLVESLGAEPIGPPWTVTHLAVLESDTRPTGAVHTVRDELALGGP